MVKKLFRGDIYICSFKGSSIVIGEHPILIISSNKSLMKNKTQITGIPLSSNCSNVLKNNIILDKKFLKYPSKIQTEKIVTVEIDSLISFVGHVDDMSEINKCIKRQLDLDAHNRNMGDLISIMNNNSNKDLEILKSKIYESYYSKDYSKTEIICDEIIKLGKEKVQRYYIWLGFYVKAMIFTKNNNIEDGLLNIQQAKNYLELNVNNKEYKLTLWSYARLCESTDRELSIRLYSELATSYELAGLIAEKISCIFNVCRLHGDKEGMKELIARTEAMQTWIYIISKEEFIENMKKELAEEFSR